MSEKYICLQTEHVDQFQCDGQACQSRCCKGWKIVIDDVIWKKYKKIKGKELRKKVLSHIEKKENVRYIKLRPDGSCPFLRKDFLCSLQHDCGEAYLSSICRTYPRNVCVVGDFMERSLALTCPVAAKQVLLKEEPMIFEQTEVTLEAPTWAHRSDWEKGIERLPEIQYAAISILQNRKYTIDQRLIVLGFFLDQLQDSEEENWEEIIRIYTSEEIDSYAEQMVRAIHFNTPQYLKAMFGLIEAVYGSKSDLHIWSYYLDYVTQVFGFDEKHIEVPVEELVSAYERQYPSARKALIEKYSHVLENYLVNEFFSHMYPFSQERSFRQNYRVFLLGYKLLEFFAIAAMLQEDEKFNTDLLLGAIISFSYWMDHTPKFQKHVIQEAINGGDDLAQFMKCLLQG